MIAGWVTVMSLALVALVIIAAGIGAFYNVNVMVGLLIVVIGIAILIRLGFLVIKK